MEGSGQNPILSNVWVSLLPPQAIFASWQYRPLYFIHSIDKYVLSTCHCSRLWGYIRTKPLLLRNLNPSVCICVEVRGKTGMKNKQANDRYILPGGKYSMCYCTLDGAQTESQSSRASPIVGCPPPRIDCVPCPESLLPENLTNTFCPSSTAPWLPMAEICQLSRSFGAPIFWDSFSVTYLPPSHLYLGPRFPLWLKPWLRVTLTLHRVPSRWEGRGWCVWGEIADGLFAPSTFPIVMRLEQW